MNLLIRKLNWRVPWGIAFALSCSLSSGAAMSAQAPAKEGATFSNPLKNNGPDPWVYMWKGNYYCMNTPGRNLALWKTKDITDLRNVERKVVWTPEPGTAWSNDIWAPELYRWGNKWYIYFAADAGQNPSHRIFVVENSSDDPAEGRRLNRSLGH